ncbi:light-regulated protein, chloroplastic-like [Nymphaea colorata]|nr:light-regulated protein, chloroplastic-like [Nymphaea colorata]
MQAAFSLSTPTSITRSTKSPPSLYKTKPRTKTVLPCPQVKTTAEPLAFNYNSTFSVFPAEACEVVGGAACATIVCPDVKPRAETAGNYGRWVLAEQVDREYLQYEEAKTVFRSEACDDLGGEFCEAEYQTGDY